MNLLGEVAGQVPFGAEKDDDVGDESIWASLEGDADLLGAAPHQLREVRCNNNNNNNFFYHKFLRGKKKLTKSKID